MKNISNKIFQKEAEEFRQLISGNPGTSFIVCLLYILKKKHQAKVANKEQLSVFVNGIVHCRRVFFSGILNTFAKKYKRKITAYTNEPLVIALADSELDKKNVDFRFNKLNLKNILKLLTKFEYIVLSVDLHFFYKEYHDFHFCCINKQKREFVVFEPKYSNFFILDATELEELLHTTEKDLSDCLCVFCC